MPRVVTLFGTRPEAIKFAPVIHALERHDSVDVVNVISSQHTDLLYPVIDLFGIDIARDLQVMRPGQSPNQVLVRVMTAMDDVINAVKPDLLLVQGDTTTALSGALSAFHEQVDVGHIEAGLRTDNLYSPFPEEMNRRVIGRIARLHFAATTRNVSCLESEGVPGDFIHLTGNPVVDALQWIQNNASPSAEIRDRVERHDGRRLVVLTTHRRENFGEVMRANLVVLRDFVDRHEDVVLVFPVHPNPEVRSVTASVLPSRDRVELLDPLEYSDFVYLLSQSWLIVSDSGGVQEEAPSLGKPLLVIRENTERPEAIASGVAKLVGNAPERLEQYLEEAIGGSDWVSGVSLRKNPFGAGDAGEKIAAVIAEHLA